MDIQRLNMDNSWYLRIGNLRLLADPWLEGAEIDYFRWFNTQWHRTAPISYSALPDYDAVLITQQYPDHFHIQTLQRLQPPVIILPDTVFPKARGLFPNAQILPISTKNPSCEVRGVKIERMLSTTRFGPDFHAISISDGNEAVILAPHGHRFKNAGPIGCRVKLLLTTFNDYRLPFFLGGQLAPGMEGLQKMIKAFQPEFVTATHDEDKFASGLVARLARVMTPKAEDLERLSALGTSILSLPDYQPVSI